MKCAMFKILSLIFFALRMISAQACEMNFTEFMTSCSNNGLSTYIGSCWTYYGYISKIGCFDSVETFHCPYAVEIEAFKSCPAGETKPVPQIPSPDITFNSCGSIIQTDNQVLIEEVTLKGVPWPLVYSSHKVKGRLDWYTTKIPLTHPTESIPSYVDYVKSTIQIAGRVISNNFTPAPNTIQTFTWDGKDQTNAAVFGSVPVQITVENAYDFAPITVPALEPGEVRLFSGNGGTTHHYAIYPIRSSFFLGNVFGEHFGIGGWDFSVHHHYDNVRGILYLGDGTMNKVSSIVKTNGDRWVLSKDRSEIYVFDSNYKHLETKDALLNIAKLTFSYNVSGKLIKITDKYGNETTIQYTAGNPTSITSPFGHVTSLDTDTNGYISEITSPANESHVITYDGNGLLLAFENPSGVTSTMTYDADGKLLTDTSSAGNSTTLIPFEGDYGGGIYEKSELLRTRTHNQVISTNGNYQRYTYYPNQMQDVYSEDRVNLTEVRNINGANISIGKTHDAIRFPSTLIPNAITLQNGNNTKSYAFEEVCSLSDPDDPFSYTTLTSNILRGGSHLTQTVFTKSTKTFVETTPLGREIITVLNADGDPASITYGPFTPVSFSYNINGQLTQIAQGVNRDISYSYNSAGYLQSVENALGQITSFAYNSAGRVTSQTLPDSRVISYTYDPNGNLTSVTPPNRPAHDFTYNDFALPDSYIPPTIAAPNNYTTTYTYNDDKQMIAFQRPNGDAVTFDYGTTTGDLDSITLPSGLRTFYYSFGMISTSNSEDGISRYPTFSGTMMTGDYVTDGGNLAYTLTTIYNDMLLVDSDNLTSGSTNWTVNYTYNNDELLTTAGSLEYTRTASTGLISQSNLSNVVTTYGYSAAFGELSEILAEYSSTQKYKEELTRDHLGRITEMKETYGSNLKTKNYTYDSTGRLTAVTVNGSPYSSYSYDNNSNRTSETISGVTKSATYDDQDRLITFGTKSFAYNLNGEMTSFTDSSNSTTTSYSWDALGNLKSVTLPTKTINYKVDAHNRRTSKLNGSTLNEHYIWNTRNQLIATTDSTGDVTAIFFYGHSSHSPEYVIKGSTTYKIVSNHLGSPVQVINVSNGTVSQQIEYDEFGKMISDTSPGFIPFGFAGCLYDKDTKLCKFGARDYDASIGRWLSKDPILFNGGDTNLYGYVMQDPINWIDTDGLSKQRPIMNPADDNPLKPGGSFGGGGYGRGGQKLAPINGTSAAHTTFKYGPNGNITSYATWKPNPQNPKGFDLQMRFDAYGSHGNIQGPHVHEPGGVRSPNKCEFPGGN